MNGNSEKTAIVTGASSGIGRASAEALAQGGYAAENVRLVSFHNSN